MPRRRSFRFAAVAMVAVIALSGCVPSAPPASSTIDTAAQKKVDQLRSGSFDEASVKIVGDELVAAGVAVEDAWDDTAHELVRITPWQLQNMAIEAANGGGASGAELDAASPAPPGVPPIGYLISAWALSYDSDSARFAHALLGDQDFHHPESILFPSAVTTLFLADATADYDAADVPIDGAIGPAVGTMSLAGYLQPQAAGPCSAVANFIQRAIATVVNALKVDTSKGGVVGFLGHIWNAAVDLAAGLVKGLIEVVTRPVVQLLVNIFGAIETIRQLSSYLAPWRATVTPKPETNLFGIGDEKVHGRMTVTVLDNRLPIPGPVLDCAEVFGVNLRDAGSAAGSKVTWTPTNMARPDLSRRDTAEDVLDRNQLANYDYLTGQESAKDAKGEEHAGLLKLVASVQRNDIEKIRKLFTALVFDQVPSSIRGIVTTIAGPILDAATTHLTALTDVRSTGYVAITFHGKPPAEPTAEATAAVTCLASGVMPGHYVGSDTLHYESAFWGFVVDWLYTLDVTVGTGGELEGTMVADSQTSGSSTDSKHYVYVVGGTVDAPLLDGQPASQLPGFLSAITGDCKHLDWTWDWRGVLDGDPGGDWVVAIHAPLVVP
ncbi:MAG: hypothetical protein JWP19_1567 [Rhodoglobus sp.]|nr:hypothetical protein [Rhodoglobus sp.]